MAISGKFSDKWWKAKGKASQDKFLATMKEHGEQQAITDWMNRPYYKPRSERAIKNEIEYAKWRLRELGDSWKNGPIQVKIDRKEMYLRDRLEWAKKEQVKQEEKRAWRWQLAIRMWERQPDEPYPPAPKLPAEIELERFLSDPAQCLTAEHESEIAKWEAKRNKFTKILFKLGGEWHEKRKQKVVNKKRRLKRKPRRNLLNDVTVHLEFMLHKLKRKSFTSMKHISYTYNKPIRWVQEAKAAAISKGLITEDEWKANLRGPGRPRKGKARGPYKKARTAASGGL